MPKSRHINIIRTGYRTHMSMSSKISPSSSNGNSAIRNSSVTKLLPKTETIKPQTNHDNQREIPYMVLRSISTHLKQQKRKLTTRFSFL